MSRITDYGFLFQTTFGTSKTNLVNNMQVSQMNSSSVPVSYTHLRLQFSIVIMLNPCRYLLYWNVLYCHYQYLPHSLLRHFPVSYTHLDVYKRQISLSAALYFLLFVSIPAAFNCFCTELLFIWDNWILLTKFVFDVPNVVWNKKP